jgi:hypothetical protein
MRHPPLRASLEAGLVMLAAFSLAPLKAQQPRSIAAKPPQLYLLAGTPNGDFGYPATLYLADGGKLRLIREVVSQDEGVRAVQMWGNTIFLAHPAQKVSAVSVIHIDDPNLVDDVLINQDSRLVFTAFSQSGQSDANSGVVGDLLPSFKGEVDPANLVSVEVLNAPNSSRERVLLNRWEVYQALRKQGETDGPDYINDFTAAVIEGQLVFPPAFGHRILIDTIPTVLRDAMRGNTLQTVSIIAASERYLLVKLDFTYDEWISGKTNRASDIFIHDRVLGSWRTIQVEGNKSRSTMFGSWLATTTAEFNRDKTRISPGRENEPNSGGAGELGRISASRPNIRNLYSQRETWFPGVLLLQNLENNQRIRIETGQEDSEILWVGNSSVLYRVNDVIYQARIAGNQLLDTSMIVRDEDVREVHWSFWGSPLPAQSK